VCELRGAVLWDADAEPDAAGAELVPELGRDADALDALPGDLLAPLFELTDVLAEPAEPPEAAWPGMAWAKAVPRPSDTAAAPPVIHSESLRTVASRSSRRAAALCMVSRIRESPPAGGFVMAVQPSPPGLHRWRGAAAIITGPGYPGTAGNGTT
jgi:hypothetical protein